MKNVKFILKLFIGVTALLLVMVMFSCALRKGNLETDNLKAWRSASFDRRGAAVRARRAFSELVRLRCGRARGAESQRPLHSRISERQRISHPCLY